MDKYPSIDEQKNYYDQLWESKVRKRVPLQQYKNRIHAIITLMKRKRLRNVRILELGCGIGNLSAKMLRFGQVEAVDLSSRAIEVARRRYPKVQFRTGDVLSLPFSSSSYDVVVSSEMIEHLPVSDREKFIRIVWDCLVPNGYLILTTPNKTLSQDLINYQLLEEHLEPNELKELLNQHFDILRLTTVHRLFPVLGHRSKLIQIVRMICYEGLRLRLFIENPERQTFGGLITVVMAKKRNSLRSI